MPYAGYTGWIVQLDPTAVATNRTMLDINNPDVSGISIGAEGSNGAVLDWGVAALTQFMAQNGQWGNAPADYVAPNRTITIPIGIGMSESESAPDPEIALQNLRMKVALLQRESGQLLRQRKNLNGTMASPLYADIVDAQLDVPDDWMETAGVEPGITLTLICLPDFYGAELTLDTISAHGFCSGVLTSGGVPANIQGDYPARCRLVVTDTSNNDQHQLYWGARSRYYSATAPIVIAGTTLGGGGGATTKSNSQFPTVESFTIDIATGFLSHTGSYRVLARVQSNTANSPVFLAWSTGSFPNSAGADNTAFNLAAANTWYLADLGIVNIPTLPASVAAGQSWSFQIFSVNSGPTLYCDYIALVPVSETAGYVTGPIAFDDPAIAADCSLQLGSDGIYGVKTGAAYLIGSALGDYPRLPPSGLENRPLQLFVKPLRSDTSYDNADPAVDTFTVVPHYRPCYLGRI